MLKIRLFLVLFISGLIIGILTSNKMVINDLIKLDNVSKFRGFINIFTTNIWSIFVVWYVGYSKELLFLVYPLIFLKGYIEGLVMISLMKNLAVVNFGNFIACLLYWIIIVPWYGYLVIKVLKDARRKEKKKENIFYMSVIVVTIYSLIVCLVSG